MKRQKLAQSLISVTIDRGISEMKDDPKRSIRKLADLAKHFAKTDRQIKIFNAILHYFQNDDCPYYQLTENLLHDTAPIYLKTIGINIGYSSIIYGTKAIQENENKYNIKIPSSITMEIDNKTDVAYAENIIKEASSLGISIYGIICHTSVHNTKQLCSSALKYPDCCFFVFLPDNEYSEAELCAFSSSPNVVILLDCESSRLDATISLLTKNHMLFGLYISYDDSDIMLKQSDEYINSIVSHKVPSVCYIPRKGTSSSCIEAMSEFTLDSRLNYRYPILLLNHTSDIIRISRILSECSHHVTLTCDNPNYEYPDYIYSMNQNFDIIQLLQNAAHS